jgi:lipid-A-disaccharide synthase-like uncharacterized protein
MKLPTSIIVVAGLLFAMVIGSMVYLILASGDQDAVDVFMKNIILLINTIVSLYAAAQARKAMAASNETKVAVETSETRRSEGMD